MAMIKNSFVLADGEQFSDEQNDVIHQAVAFANHNLTQSQTRAFVIEGGAGAGKSVVLFESFKQLQATKPHWRNFLLVNHAEMWKSYRELASYQPDLKKNQFLKPTTFINQMTRHNQTADVVLIDEAHLLLTAPDRYNKFQQENQLVEILKHARVVILVFDAHQVLKLKSMWHGDQLQTILAPFRPETVQLSEQYRMVGQSQSVVEWIDQLTQHKKILDVATTPSFDLRIYNDANRLYTAICQENQRVGMSRILATTDYPYTVNRGKWYVTLDDFKLPWDQLDTGVTPWALRPETIDEVGSVYTIQGFDLNYAGVIIGPGIRYDNQKDQLIIDPSHYEDKAAFRSVGGKNLSLEDKQSIMLNALNILLKRGRHGLFIAVADPVLRQKLLASVPKQSRY